MTSESLPSAGEPLFRVNWFWLVFALCALASLAPIWSVKYLPMVDLPQHAAQISIINNLDDPNFKFRDQFEIHWFSPYAAAIAVSSILARFFDILTSLKIALTLAVIGFPLSIRYLLKQSGGDPWWSLLGFPFSFGFGFYWGFISNVFAVPIGIFFIAFGYRYARFPNLKRAAILSLFSIGLFFSHLIVLLICSFIVFLLIATIHRKKALLFALPLFLPAPLLLIWMKVKLQIPGDSGWHLSWARLVELPSLLLDLSHDWTAFFISLGLLISCLATSARPQRSITRWLPFLGILFLYMVAPFGYNDAVFLYQRAAVFVIPMLMIGLSAPLQKNGWIYVGRFFTVGLIFCWMIILTGRFQRFNQEAQGFDRIKNKIPYGQKLLYLAFNNSSRFTHGNLFLHFPAWSQAEKGGSLGFTFALIPPHIARYKPGRAILDYSSAHPILWRPDQFSWSTQGQFFDYFIIRSGDDMSHFFHDANPAVHLVERAGDWWLYKKADS